MDERDVRVGQRVRVILSGGQVAAGDTGVVTELRGWNLEHGRRVGRFVGVWIERESSAGHKSHTVAMLTTNMIEKE